MMIVSKRQLLTGRTEKQPKSNAPDSGEGQVIMIDPEFGRRNHG